MMFLGTPSKSTFEANTKDKDYHTFLKKVLVRYLYSKGLKVKLIEGDL